MAASSSGGTSLGCVGKCTSGLSNQQLDLITDHVHRTLGHAQGKRIFAKYLSQGQRTTDLACLELYEQCSVCIDKEQRYRICAKPMSIESLENDVNSIVNAVEELDDVPEIDLALLVRYTEALRNRSRESMIDVLQETKLCLMNHLKQAHKGFRTYVMQPCPRS